MTDRIVSIRPKERMIQGLDRLREVVGATLGPMGQNVVIEPHMIGPPTHTKDGVTVAGDFVDDDPVAMVAARSVITAAREMASKIGDGTTTVVILSCELAKNMLELPAGSRREIIKELEELYTRTCDIVRKKAIPISCEYDALYRVALLACNHREELAKLVATVASQVTKDGVITFRQSVNGEHRTEVTSGFHFDRGYCHPEFVKKETVGDNWDAEDTFVFLYDGILSDAKDAGRILEAAKIGMKSRVIVIADDIVQGALPVLVVNNMTERAGVTCVGVKAPKIGVRRKDVMEDIAAITGAHVYSVTGSGPLIKHDASYLLEHHLGVAARVIVSGITTTIISNAGDKAKVDRRVQQIRDLLPVVEQTERMHLEDRLAKLSGAVGTIQVGGRDEAEIKSNMYLVEDAIHACMTALNGGVIPAGGMTFKWALQLAEKTKAPLGPKSEARRIFRAVMSAPLLRLYANALEEGNPGFVSHGKVAEFIKAEPGMAYNVMTDRWENFVDEFIVEPAQLAIAALNTSLGCGITLGSTAATITRAPTPPAK